jgi:hypothetical protein
VLATVTHFNSEVLQLWLTGAAAPLEPTAEHKFFAADRRAWVAARELVAGERLQTRRGPVALARIASRPGLHRVYNLEVETEHWYFVSREEVLSHNVLACIARTAYNEARDYLLGEGMGWLGGEISERTGIDPRWVGVGIALGAKSNKKGGPSRANEPEIVNHGSQRAARRAANRDAGIGKHGRSEPLADDEFRAGSRPAVGGPGTRKSWTNPDNGAVVHHDPWGHRDGAIPPHYGVEAPGRPTRHHTYPSDHDPRTNR